MERGKPVDVRVRQVKALVKPAQLSKGGFGQGLLPASGGGLAEEDSTTHRPAGASDTQRPSLIWATVAIGNRADITCEPRHKERQLGWRDEEAMAKLMEAATISAPLTDGSVGRDLSVQRGIEFVHGGKEPLIGTQRAEAPEGKFDLGNHPGFLVRHSSMTAYS
jgi:hypothetical protein